MYIKLSHHERSYPCERISLLRSAACMMRHSLGNIVSLAVGFTLGVLLTSALYGSSPLNSSDGSAPNPCLMVKLEGDSKVVKQQKHSSPNSRDIGENCSCDDQLDRLKRLARVALFVQNYTKFRNCLGDLAPTAPMENMDDMMEFLYPRNEDPIVDFRDSRRKLFRPGTQNEPQSLKDEYIFKKGVLVGVLTQQEYLSTRAKALYETWGKEVDKLILFVGEDCNVSADLSHLPIVKLEGVPDHVYPPLKKAFAVMKYMYSHHINEFNWFIRADDDMYLRADKLTDLLNKMNPYEQVYLGRAGAGRKEDLERLELLPHERYCMGGPGVILSNGAMRGVGPHLDNCLNAVLHHDAHSNDKWNDDDVEIGRCLSRKINTQCSSSAESRTLFKFDYSGDTLTPPTLWTDPRLEELISVHPVKNSGNMHSLHHFYKSLKFQEGYEKLHNMVGYLNKLCKLLPPNLAPPPLASVGCDLKLHPQLNHVNTSRVFAHIGYTPGGKLSIKDYPSTVHNPRNKFDLLTWTRFNNSQIQSIFGPSPQHYLLPSFRQEMLQVLNMLQSYVQTQPGMKAAKISHVLDGYTRYDTHIGREYLLTVKVLTKGARPLYRKFHLVREIRPDFSLVEEHISLSTPTVHVILPLIKVDDRFYDFLSSYADTGLRYKENKLHLIVVVFNYAAEEQIQTIVDDFTKDTFPAQVSIVTAIGAFNRLRGIEVAMATLESGNSLVFLADIDVRFSSGFFRRCRSNAVLGHRVYFPVAFWLFDSPGQRLGRPFDPHHPPRISPTSGEWGYYNYWLTCLYKADYDSIGGYRDSRYTVELFERASSSRHLEVMQAPDPGLYRMWSTKTCKAIKSSSKREMCAGMQVAGSKVQKADLAEYVGEMLGTKDPFEMGERIT